MEQGLLTRTSRVSLDYLTCLHLLSSSVFFILYRVKVQQQRAKKKRYRRLKIMTKNVYFIYRSRVAKSHNVLSIAREDHECCNEARKNDGQDDIASVFPERLSFLISNFLLQLERALGSL